MNRHSKSFRILITMVFVVWSAAVPAHETDQFSNRADPIADSTELLNEKVNAAIARVAEKQRMDDDQMAVVNALFGKLGSRFLVDRLEGWAIKSPEVEKLQSGRFDSIYSGHPIWATRVTTFFGVGDTIRIHNQLVGTDKIGHFMSQGRKIYRRYLKYESEERAVVQAAHAEFMVFGQLSNGNYSNADLVANYEGHRFFRSLFEDDIVSGKPAILRWENDGWIVQRNFDWSDHVNEYWDEALNVNHFDSLLYPYMVKQFVLMCPQYWEYPSLYTITDEQPLKDRYAHLGMKDNSDLRLDSLCAKKKGRNSIAGVTPLKVSLAARSGNLLPRPSTHR